MSAIAQEHDSAFTGGTHNTTPSSPRVSYIAEVSVQLTESLHDDATHVQVRALTNNFASTDSDCSAQRRLPPN